MRPSIRQLEYLVALADHLNFRRAAESCHVTQPALSAQIQQLETLLGAELFERDRRHVFATEAGRRLAERAERILTEVDELVDAARTFREPLTGTLRLGLIPTVAPYVLPGVLPLVKRRYPELKLLLREARTAELVKELARGELDLLLLALDVELGDLATLPLYEDPFVLAAPEVHPLAKRKVVREADLSQHEVMLLEDGHCLRDHALAICSQAGAPEMADFRASSLPTLVRMVAGGVGVTLLPSMAVSSEVRARDNIVVRPLVRHAPPRTVGLAWRPFSSRVGEFQLLAGLLKERPPDGVRVV